MREQELRKHINCSICNKPIGHTGLPLFWIVKIERHGLKMDAIRRQDGLGAMLGNSKLAQVMGPDQELTEPMMDPIELTVCEACATERYMIAGLPEMASQ